MPSKITPSGTRIQSGTPVRRRDPGRPSAMGLLVRGVVMATYVTDDPGHPLIADLKHRPCAVYCDVVVFPNIPGQRWFAMKQVLVSQKRGGLHDDDLWKPRATTMNITTGVLDSGTGSNPAQFDGDHVLIGFLDNSFDEPIILRGLPHPSRDQKNELYPVGKRLKLMTVDGNPDFVKHQGVFRGVDGDGNYVVDSTFANAGTLLPAGIEPPPDATGTSGNQSYNLPQAATHEVTFWNMTAPIVPVEVAKMKMSKDALEVLITLLPCLKVEGSALTAKLTLGSGTVSATIAEHLQTLWTQLKTWMDTHVHPTGTGPSGVTPTPGPAWAANIKSGKLTFPDG